MFAFFLKEIGRKGIFVFSLVYLIDYLTGIIVFQDFSVHVLKKIIFDFSIIIFLLFYFARKPLVALFQQAGESPEKSD